MTETKKIESAKEGKRAMMEKIAVNLFSRFSKMTEGKAPILEELFRSAKAGDPVAEAVARIGEYAKPAERAALEAIEQSKAIPAPTAVANVLESSPSVLKTPASVGATLGGTAGYMTDTSEEETTPFGTRRRPGHMSDTLRNIATGAAIGSGLTTAGKLHSIASKAPAELSYVPGMKGKQLQELGLQSLGRLGGDQKKAILNKIFEEFKGSVGTPFKNPSTLSKQHFGDIKDKLLSIIKPSEYSEIGALPGMRRALGSAASDIYGASLPSLSKMRSAYDPDSSAKAMVAGLSDKAPTLFKELGLAPGATRDDLLAAVSKMQSLKPGNIPYKELEKFKGILNAELASKDLLTPEATRRQIMGNVVTDPGVLQSILSGGLTTGGLAALLTGGASIPAFGIGAAGGLASGISSAAQRHATRLNKITEPVMALQTKLLDSGMSERQVEKLLDMFEQNKLGPNAGELLRRSKLV